MTSVEFDNDTGRIPFFVHRLAHIRRLFSALLLHGLFWYWARGVVFSADASKEYYEGGPSNLPPGARQDRPQAVGA